MTAQVIRIYLDELLADAAAKGLDPDTLVLGCTHYPLLRPLIEEAVPAGMRVIDSAESTADAALRLINGRTNVAAGECDNTLHSLFRDGFGGQVPAPRIALSRPSGGGRGARRSGRMMLQIRLIS